MLVSQEERLRYARSVVGTANTKLREAQEQLQYATEHSETLVPFTEWMTAEEEAEKSLDAAEAAWASRSNLSQSAAIVRARKAHTDPVCRRQCGPSAQRTHAPCVGTVPQSHSQTGTVDPNLLAPTYIVGNP